MIYTPLTKLALTIAYRAHEGQKDRAGVPYIFHPIHLAEQMPDEDTTVAALLHDVVEDTELTFDDLARMGIPSRIIDSLKLLTHTKHTPYMDYIRALAGDPVAKTVKLADLRHNSDLSRLDTVTYKDRERVEKYARAIRLLQSSADPSNGGNALDAISGTGNDVVQRRTRMTKIEEYKDIMRRYRAGEYGEEHLTLHDILSRAGAPNLLKEMSANELEELISTTTSGPLKAYFNGLKTNHPTGV